MRGRLACADHTSAYPYRCGPGGMKAESSSPAVSDDLRKALRFFRWSADRPPGMGTPEFWEGRILDPVPVEVGEVMKFGRDRSGCARSGP